MNEGNEHESSFVKKVLRRAARVARATALSQISRIRVASDRRTAQELKQLDWARAAIDEGARLSKASLEYAVQLGAAWRTLTLDAWRAALGGDVAASDCTPKRG